MWNHELFLINHLLFRSKNLFSSSRNIWSERDKKKGIVAEISQESRDGFVLPSHEYQLWIQNA